MTPPRKPLVLLDPAKLTAEERFVLLNDGFNVPSGPLGAPRVKPQMPYFVGGVTVGGINYQQAPR